MNAIDTSMNVRAEHCDWTVTGRTDGEIRELVSEIVESASLQTLPCDRRSDKRVAYPHLLTMVPIADGESIQPIGDPVDVVGKCLAERGLTFFHQQNLPFRRAIVAFDTRDYAAAHLILNISWSRFLRPGWYDSGGRFTHALQECNQDLKSDERRGRIS